MVAAVNNGAGLAVYHALATATFLVVLYFSFFSGPAISVRFLEHPRSTGMMSPPEFVKINGTQLILDGEPFYFNGWNSYWLLDQSVSPSTRPRVAEMFAAAAAMGLTVCRTWAFNDGAHHHALQLAPGVFDERVFQALDWIVAEARRHGVRLLLSMANNLDAYGGKAQYVRWAWEEGAAMAAGTNDSFFSDPSIRSYFKNYIYTLLTRKNHLNGVLYMDDPTIFGWELMNEPRCASDPAGDALQAWIEEMAAYVKSIDKKHPVTLGLEGFYGPASPAAKRAVNPGEWFGALGSDFIRNSAVPAVDFASVHVYPDSWLPRATVEEKERFVAGWVASHVDDGERKLKKPVVFTEFGQSRRGELCDAMYNAVYGSAQRGGAAAGALIWQLAAGGMEEFHDEFAVVPAEAPALHGMMKRQSCRLAMLRRRKGPAVEQLCGN